MKTWQKIFTVVSVVAMGWVPGGDHHYLYQLWASMSAIAVILALGMSTGMRWPVALLFLWSSLSAIFVSTWPSHPYLFYGKPIADAFSMVSLRSLSILFGVAFVGGLNKNLKWVLVGLSALAFVDCILVIMLHHGVLDNAAMDGSFIACMVPLIWFLWKDFRTLALFLYPIAAFAIYKADSSTAWAAFFLVHAAGLLQRTHPVLAVVTLFYGAFSGAFVMGHELLNPNGRTYIWRGSLKYWWTNFNPLLGSGTGTFELFGPHLQSQGGALPTTFFIWMHNDWIQILFEQGAIGLALALVVYFWALKETWRSQCTFACLVGYGMIMCTQMPLRYAPSALFGAVLLRLALRSKRLQ